MVKLTKHILLYDLYLVIPWVTTSLVSTNTTNLQFIYTYILARIINYEFAIILYICFLKLNSDSSEDIFRYSYYIFYGSYSTIVTLENISHHCLYEKSRYNKYFLLHFGGICLVTVLRKSSNSSDSIKTTCGKTIRKKLLLRTLDYFNYKESSLNFWWLARISETFSMLLNYQNISQCTKITSANNCSNIPIMESYTNHDSNRSLIFFFSVGTK